jgi:uncharacterized lipoprotein YehR (DUF1307 family)
MKKNIFKNLLLLLFVFLTGFTLSACGSSKSSTYDGASSPTTVNQTSSSKD